ncbi:MAG: FAD-binding oxidoreductase [Deltaproteobacteria bacterium]|nr:FAD-binding oxidoreductase [Deltaproteobacteria bacterium]MCW5806057.1 FAD-binding oxidoreductase [Deltaproteobacteria bacterium]
MPRSPWFGAGVAALALGLGRALRRGRATRRTLPVENDALHAAKLHRIAEQLRAHPPGMSVSLRKHGPPHQVPKFGDLRRRDPKIDVADLTQILSIDPRNRVCWTESGVMFRDLVKATLRYGLVPMVVPELSTITVGGAVSGCSVESTSFRHGGFHDTCLAYEVMTARGDVLLCTPDNQHRLLFEMMHGSFGTLGILTKLALRLMPARPFVHVVYDTFRSIEALCGAIEEHAEYDDTDFIDGMLHAPDRLVLATGNFVDDAPYTHAYDWTRVYYTSTRDRADDFLRTQDYLFRYDHGVTNVHPKSFVGRLLFGKLLDSGTTLGLAEKFHFLLPRERPTVTLDVFLPISKAPEFFDWYRRDLGHFPVWCVPYRRVRDYAWLSDDFYRDLYDTMFLDLAIYGMPQRDGRNVHRIIEDKLRELGGVKTLISHNYYTQDEFWETWNKPNYDAVKQVVDPDNIFRDIYTKTCRTAMGLV